MTKFASHICKGIIYDVCQNIHVVVQRFPCGRGGDSP